MRKELILRSEFVPIRGRHLRGGMIKRAAEIPLLLIHERQSHFWLVFYFHNQEMANVGVQRVFYPEKQKFNTYQPILGQTHS